jgi:undecaprenyl diphosphate synthase
VSSKETPNHIAIVMDGNGRWAQARGLPRVSGHEMGVQSVKSSVKSCLTHGVPALTLFAFSRENWLRPQPEVDFLMNLFLSALKEHVSELSAQGVRLQFVGERSAFSPDLQALMHEAEHQTASNQALVLTIAMNYSGRWDIVQACQKIAHAVQAGEVSADAVNDALIEQRLSLSDLPEPDLLIRTSGEIRISNFMLWQLAYTELYFTETYWPDFDEAAFLLALNAYRMRDRRFGTLQSSIKEVDYA